MPVIHCDIRRGVGAIAFWLVGLGAIGHAGGAAPDWVLMARHGECATLDAAAQRKPVFAGVATPEDLVTRLRQRGVEVAVDDTIVEDVRIVTVTAPEAGIAVIFVPPKLCP